MLNIFSSYSYHRLIKSMKDPNPIKQPIYCSIILVSILLWIVKIKNPLIYYCWTDRSSSRRLEPPHWRVPPVSGGEERHSQLGPSPPAGLPLGWPFRTSHPLHRCLSSCLLRWKGLHPCWVHYFLQQKWKTTMKHFTFWTQFQQKCEKRHLWL